MRVAAALRWNAALTKACCAPSCRSRSIRCRSLSARCTVRRCAARTSASRAAASAVNRALDSARAREGVSPAAACSARGSASRTAGPWSSLSTTTADASLWTSRPAPSTQRSSPGTAKCTPPAWPLSRSRSNESMARRILAARTARMHTADAVGPSAHGSHSDVVRAHTSLSRHTSSASTASGDHGERGPRGTPDQGGHRTGRRPRSRCRPRPHPAPAVPRQRRPPRRRSAPPRPDLSGTRGCSAGPRTGHRQPRAPGPRLRRGSRPAGRATTLLRTSGAPSGQGRLRRARGRRGRRSAGWAAHRSSSPTPAVPPLPPRPPSRARRRAAPCGSPTRRRQ